MARIRTLAAAAVLMAGIATQAAAGVIYSPNLDKLPNETSITTIDFTGLYDPAHPSQALSAGGANVSFSGGARLLQGAIYGVGAQPILPNGSADVRPYLVAPTGGTITLDFGSAKKYFGLLWGSVDVGNHLAFYRNSTDTTPFKVLNGSDISASANGNQGFNGTYFVDINFTDSDSYAKVIASSDTPSFEFDYVSQSVTIERIPEPAGLLVVGSGLAVLALARRRIR